MIQRSGGMGPTSYPRQARRRHEKTGKSRGHGTNVSGPETADDRAACSVEPAGGRGRGVIEGGCGRPGLPSALLVGVVA